MKIESNGILISLRPLGERDSIARIFTSDFGVICGMMRGAQIAKKNKPLIGQFGMATWNARLDSQLGVFHWDSTKNLSAPLMIKRETLECMNSAFALIAAMVPEREQYQSLYHETIDLLTKMATASDIYNAYLEWETSLLRELGYALNLTTCAQCGTNKNLEYLSPRTGRAVCENCAAPYIDKLYKLPLNLNITRHFLEHACVAQGIDLPPARKMLICM